VLDLCPQASFFNYSNPMTAICRAIRKETGAPVIGLCHGVIGVAQYLARFIGKPLEEMNYTAIGLNHLTWFTELRWKSQDAWPLVREEIARQKEAGEQDAHDRDRPAIANDPFSWSLFELFGAFPAVLDSHVTEFFPQFFREGEYYGKKFGVDEFVIQETIDRGDARYKEMLEIAGGDQPLPDEWFGRASGEHEQVIDILDSIESDAGRVYSVNVPNQGQVPNLPIDAVIECPAAMDAAGAHALAQPPLSTGLAGVLLSRIACAEATVDAALKGDRKLFIQALLIDGSVSSLETAEKLADDLLAAHAQYLPQFAG
jgi:alpha-galactosidase